MPDLAQIDTLILCGGLGNRLRSTIGETQKVMAEINGRPFLDLLIQHLKEQGLRRVILGTGYRSQAVEEYYQQHNPGLTIEFSREAEPLGTGGAVKNAEHFILSDPFFVLNGDSFCPVDYSRLLDVHCSQKARITIVIRRVEDAKDYGSVRLDADRRIVRFDEKKNQAGARMVNAGIYCFNRDVLSLMTWGNNFSLERDLFPSLKKGDLAGHVTEADFYDIGTPERFSRAQQILRKGGVSG